MPSDVSPRMKILASLLLFLPAALAVPFSGSPAPSSTEDLLGATLEVLRGELGPPVNILAGEVLMLDYHNEEGDLVRGAVLVAAGTVVKAAPGLVRSTEESLHRELLLGHPLEVLEAFGPAEDFSCGTSHSTLYFEGWEVDVVGGLVVDIRSR